MFHKYQTLLVRALNATRQGYFPTYVGLRLVGDQLLSGGGGYLGRMLITRLTSGDYFRFKRFKLYKGSLRTCGVVSHQYRDCLAPSPATTIAEALMLAIMSADPVFRVSDRVYSYWWPRTHLSGGNYEYFVEGYKRRNNEVAEALKRPDSVAVVIDIKNFYPSVDRGQVDSALKTILAGAEKTLHTYAEAVLGFYTQMLTAGEQGIPIGPASAHVLGHLVLKQVDKDLTERFGKNYFRYVDDIVVVCAESKKAATRRIIEDCLKAYGFSPNIDKTAELDHPTWERNLLRADISSIEDFRTFTSDLTAYLAFHPDRADSIKALFSEQGLTVPVSRLLALASYSRFRYYFLRRWKSLSGMAHAISMWRAIDEDFLRRGLRLKVTYERELSELLNEPIENEPSLRRWQIQRIRRVLNTLFYLRDFSEWREKVGQFEQLPELIEQQALAEALSSGVVNSVLPFYGRGPAAFSELWSEYGQGRASLQWPTQGFMVAEIDSLITLRLYGVIPPELAEIGEDLPGSRLMRAVNQDNPIHRSNPDLSFDDEFESLRLGVTNLDLSILARTRYSLSEGTALEALTLTGSEYLS
jgi:hypothetical protein